MTLKQMIQVVVTRYMQDNFEGVRNGAKLATITAKSGEEYSIKLLDETGAEDSNYKEITKVKANSNHEVGEKVAVVFLYQDAAQPYIVGKVE